MKTVYARRLGKVEEAAARTRAAIVERERAPDRERQDRIMRRLVVEHDICAAVEAVCGLESHRGGAWVIADEREVEAAIVKFTGAWKAAALAEGFTLEEIDRKDDPPRMAFLPWDGTPFNLAVHRFAGLNLSNHAVALRFCNAAKHRHWHGEIHAREYQAALAVFEPRFEAFRAEEERRLRRRERRRERHGARDAD